MRKTGYLMVNLFSSDCENVCKFHRSKFEFHAILIKCQKLPSQ